MEQMIEYEVMHICYVACKELKFQFAVHEKQEIDKETAKNL